MKTSTILGITFIGGVSVIGYAFFVYARKQAALLKNYDYKIINFKIDTINLQLINGSISIFFSSKSDVEIIVQEFILRFYFNGKEVGYLEDQSAFVIPSRGSTTIPFRFSLNPQLVLKNITDIVSYSLRQKDAAISIRGHAKVKSGFFKVSVPIEYDTTIKEILK